MKKITIITVLLAARMAIAAPPPLTSPVPTLNPRLAAIQWAVGNWTCDGHYLDVPPFTVAHDVRAGVSIVPSVGRQWITLRYQEITATAGQPLLAIDDGITTDPRSPTTLGLRSFVDGNTGQFTGAFAIADNPDGTQAIEFTGTYTLFGVSIPFTESLLTSADRRQFSTESRVVLGVPIAFETQTCTRVVLVTPLSASSSSLVAPHWQTGCDPDEPWLCDDGGTGQGGGGTATCPFTATCDPSLPNPNLVCAGQCPGVIGPVCSSSCPFMGPNGDDDPCRHIGTCR